MKLRNTLCAALLACLVHGPALAADDEVTLNFVNADIESVVKAVGLISGKNFLIDPRVKGTINIVSSKPVAKGLTYQILLSALRLQGYAAVEAGGVTKIVPEADAKLHYTPTVGPREGARGDQLVTQVYPLRHESAVQLVPVLRPMISPNNLIAAYPGNNSLVITDYADNLKRIDRIIDSIDQPSGSEPVVIALRYASALDVAQTLNKLMGEAAPAGAPAAPADASQRLVILSDARTNSLLVRSDNPSRITRVRALAQSLDTPTSAAGNIHVIYLKNAEAVKVAQTLRGILGTDGGTATAQATAQPTATGQAAAAATATATTAATGGLIHADAASNSLIVVAPDPVYNNLRSVIDKLDVRRAQVMVEALIAEVTADKAAEFGIQWQNLNGVTATSARVFGGTNLGARGTGNNIIDVASNLGSASRGLNIGVVKGQVNIPGIGTVVNLGVLAHALEADANANILSTPNLLTLDNEEAKIVIGQNVPFITGQYAQSGSTTTPTPFQTIERRDVGLTLKVKPQISEGGSVKLAIYQEVSSVQDQSNAAGVITNKRSIESTVLVDDGQIIVLGGLIQDNVTNGIDKVPGLGDVPVIGNLFKFESRRRVKTNLMVFLRPYVLRDSDAYSDVTVDRYSYILGEQTKMQPAHRAALPDMPAPKLPEDGLVVPPAPQQ